MKKYSLIKKANSRRTLLIKQVILITVSLIIISGMILVVPRFFKLVGQITWYPFDQTRIWIAESGSSLPKYLRERSELVGELEALKVQIATEAGTANTLRKLQVENTQFREQLGAVPDKRVLARVIGRPNQLPYDMLMLDRGEVHGVVQNAPVFLGSDQVIGFVSKTLKTTSLVTLVTTAGFISSAYVIGPNIYTLAEGVGGGVLRVRVPQGILLQTGDLVLLPALDSGVYGAVSLVESSPTQPEQYGYVVPDMALQSLYYVSIGAQEVSTHSFSEAGKVVADAKSSLFTVDLPPGVIVTPESASTTTGQIIPSSNHSSTTPATASSTL